MIATLQSHRANCISEFPSCENRSNHVPTGYEFPISTTGEQRASSRQIEGTWQVIRLHIKPDKMQPNIIGIAKS